MKVHPFSSLAVVLTAAALSPVASAQDAACEGACPAARAPSAPAALGEVAELLNVPAMPALPATFTPDDPPRLGVYIDETDVGLRVDSVIEGSLAESAGVQAGDVLYRVNGRSISGVGDVGEALSGVAPGGSVSLTVIREGEGIVGLSARLAKPEPKRAPRGDAPDVLADGFKGGFLGVTLGEGDGDGVRVVSTVPASAAWYAGLDAGDTILSIDGESVSDPDDVVGAISSRGAGEFVTIEYTRDGNTQSTRARLGQRGPSGAFGLLQRPGGGAPQMRWLDPEQNGMFFFGDDGEDFEFEFPEGMQFDGRLPRFELRGPKGDARVFRFGDGEIELGELLEGLGGDDDGVLRLRRRGAPGGRAGIDALRERLGDGATSMKITIDGDEVTVERDGEVKTMSLDEFHELEGLDGLGVKMLDGTSVFEWTNKHAGPNRKIDIEVDAHEERHELKRKPRDSDV